MGEMSVMPRKLTQEQWVQKAKLIHGDKYDYSLVEYVNAHTKVKLICSKHGMFEQLGCNHLSGNGCVKCQLENIKIGIPLTTQKFIEKANIVHNNKYDYTLTKYVNCDTKVSIICKSHGIFTQSPDNHLRLRGCPKCKWSKGELKIEKLLTISNIKYESQKRFSDCRNTLTNYILPFDFYLPDYDCCIEFDGDHHYNPISFTSDKSKETRQKNLEIIKHRDKQKDEYCNNHNIRLIRVNDSTVDKLLCLLFREVVSLLQ
jgi:hypothetical protein